MLPPRRGPKFGSLFRFYCVTAGSCQLQIQPSVQWSVVSPFSIAHPLNDNVVLITDHIVVLGVLLMPGPACPPWQWCHIAVTVDLARRGPNPHCSSNFQEVPQTHKLSKHVLSCVILSYFLILHLFSSNLDKFVASRYQSACCRVFPFFSNSIFCTSCASQVLSSRAAVNLLPSIRHQHVHERPVSAEGHRNVHQWFESIGIGGGYLLACPWARAAAPHTKNGEIGGGFQISNGLF